MAEMCVYIATGAAPVTFVSLAALLRACGFRPLHVEATDEPGLFWAVLQAGTDPEWVAEVLTAALGRTMERDVRVCEERAEVQHAQV